jgi:hypothetical protein
VRLSGIVCEGYDFNQKVTIDNKTTPGKEAYEMAVKTLKGLKEVEESKGIHFVRADHIITDGTIDGRFRYIISKYL